MRGRVHDRRPAVGQRTATRGEAFVGCATRIGRDHIDPRGIDPELLGRDLRERRLDPLPELGLAREYGHAAVGIDPNPGVEKRSVAEAPRQLWGARCLLRGEPHRGLQREAHDQRAARREKAPPRHRRDRFETDVRLEGHDPACFTPEIAALVSSAARRTARRMRMCVPHRHRFGIMWRRISASDGAGFFSSRACARMIIPAMQ